jgi:predicted nucleotidyltransferase component of viral defense system
LEAGRYPTSIAELSAWRKANKTTAEEARRRFVQYVVLASIASSEGPVTRLVLKGGNALRFVHGNSRSTLDLDFTAEGDFPDDGDTIRGHLDGALRGAEHPFQVKARCQSVTRNPKRPGATRPTYQVKVCFQLPGDRYYQNFEERKGHFAEVIELEISLNEIVCESVNRELSPRTRPVRVCSLEDILAEKLRALLQQLPRKRNRPQDVYDISSRMREYYKSLDMNKIADFLVRKSVVREIKPTKAAFNDEVRRAASVNYEEEVKVDRAMFIPFEDAWADVLSLVNRLDIPES